MVKFVFDSVNLTGLVWVWGGGYYFFFCGGMETVGWMVC